MSAPKNLDVKLLKGIHKCGASYRQISNLFNVSLSTCCYHISKRRKERQTKYREKKFKTNVNFALGKKVDNFKYHRPRKNWHGKTYSNITKNSTWKSAFEAKVSTFKRVHGSRHKGHLQSKNNLHRQGNMTKKYTTKDVLKHIGGENNSICYLTGKKLDLFNTYSYNLDHITPRSKGGSNDIENMGVATKEANMAKNDMTVEEFHTLCKEVLEHAGWNVSTPKSSDPFNL